MASSATPSSSSTAPAPGQQPPALPLGQSGTIKVNELYEKWNTFDYTTVSKIGVIADTQYCDENDGSDFSGNEKRYYRNTKVITRNAAKRFEMEKCQMVLQVGDAIDAKSKGNYLRDLDVIFEAMKVCGVDGGIVLGILALDLKLLEWDAKKTS